MKKQVYLAIDLGAESGRVMAGVWNGKRLRLQEIHRFANGPVEIAGTLRWDVLRLWSEIQDGLSRAARKYGKQIKSVGVDTWGVDSVALSRSDEIVCAPFHYRDSRTRGMMEKAFTRVPRAEIFAATGVQFMELNTLYQLLALQKQSPEVLAATDCLLMMPDFFHWCLCGAKAAEFTEATTTQFFHPTKCDWSHDLLKKFGLPTAILPRVVQPGTQLGSLRSGVAARSGLERVQVVTPASHDTGSAVVAVPATARAEGTWAYISSGTWSLMGLELREAQLSPRALEFNITNEGGVDGTYRVLKNITGLWLVQQCKREFESNGGKLEYEQLVSLATKATPFRSLVDPDDPRFVNPRSMSAAMQRFCTESGQPAPKTEGALIRCALESLALRYQFVLSCLEELSGKRVETIHVVGGGSKNALLNQFTADACNRPVVAGPVEATAMGNILVQTRTAKEIGSLAELRAAVAKSAEMETFSPRANGREVWQESCERFAKLKMRA
jgi:rhamnulokinase